MKAIFKLPRYQNNRWTDAPSKYIGLWYKMIISASIYRFYGRM